MPITMTANHLKKTAKYFESHAFCKEPYIKSGIKVVKKPRGDIENDASHNTKRVLAHWCAIYVLGGWAQIG